MDPKEDKLIVTEAEWALLNEAASDLGNPKRCISVHSVPVHVIDRSTGFVRPAPSGPVWGTDIEYTGE